MASARRQRLNYLTPRIKVWLETNGRYVFGFGLAEILQAVEQAGSIKGAAENLGKSYRYVWGRIKDAEDALGKRLVETQVGGKDAQRSALTPRARQLVADFLRMRNDLMTVAGKQFGLRFGRG